MAEKYVQPPAREAERQVMNAKDKHINKTQFNLATGSTWPVIKAQKLSIYLACSSNILFSPVELTIWQKTNDSRRASP